MRVSGRSVDGIVIDRRRARLAVAIGVASAGLLLVPAWARAEAPPKHHAPPKITGSLEDGRVLTAGEGKWKSETKPAFSYQWEVCEPRHGACTLIPGAESSTYRSTSDQVGKRLRAIVTATTPGGSASVTSRPSKKLLPGSPLEVEPPAITGDLAEGAKLLANPGVWAGSAPITYHYQWERCNTLTAVCEAIAGATTAAYTLEAADVASAMIVKVTASNAVGSATASSPETSVVGALLPVNLGLPSILGNLLEGQLLSAEPGSWSGTEPITYAYQWLECNAAGESCAEIPEATAQTLSLLSGFIGKTVEVVVTASNGAGSTSATSSPTSLVQGLLPSNTGSAPSILGSLLEGQTLSANPGSWTGTEPIGFGYQWLKCNAAGEGCEEISKATAPTLPLVTGLIGDTVKVVVTATNVAGSHSVTSSPTGLISGILPSNTGAAPSILGSLVEGQTLSANPGAWSGTEPISYGYQWLSCNAAGEGCSEISKATGSTLKLVTGLIGDTVKVVVTATNVAGSHSVTSSPSGTIAGIVPDNEVLPSITGSLLSGQLLTGHTGTWKGTEPITYSYQWQLCSALGKGCSNIAEATGSTFKLVGLDVGLTLDLIVTAKNVAGSTSATSPVTGLIGL